MKPDDGKTTSEQMECIYSHKHNCNCYMKKKPFSHKTTGELEKEFPHLKDWKIKEIENPKEKIGQAKPSLHHVPPRVLLEVAQAMMEGSKKYGIYNYRKAGVSYSTYYSSTFRHLIAWFEGEDIDPDSGLSHVVKAISGLIVLRDSMLQNNYQDDRPNTL